MATPTINLTASSVAAGSSLRYTFDISLNGIITDPTRITNIKFDTSTLVVEAASSFPRILSGADLVDSAGNLIKTFTQTGLTTGTKYSTVMLVQFSDAPANGVFANQTVHKTISSTKVLSAYNIPLVLDFNSLDSKIDVVLSSGAIDYINQYCTDGSSNSYNGATIHAYLNNGTGTVVHSKTLNSYLIGGFSIGVSNEVIHEAHAHIGTNLGSGVNSTSRFITATDRPDAPTSITPISTFQYNTDLSGADLYNVPSSAFVTVLFTASNDLSANVTVYQIFRTDLSSNGFTLESSASLIGSVRSDASGNYKYPSATGITYKYKYQDTTAVFGKYYGYQVRADNANGVGLLSSLKGVRNGTKAGAPILAAFPKSSTEITLNVTPPTFLGNFDLSSNSYMVQETTDASGAGVPFYRQADASGNITIAGLRSNVKYNYNVFAQTKNNVYTTSPGIDVSSNNIGPTFVYNSTKSLAVAVAPEALPPAPTAVTAIPLFDASGVPQGGKVKVSWTSDLSFNSQQLGFVVNRYDISNNVITLSAYDPYNPPTTPSYPLKTYTDTGVTDGSAYTYTVQSYYVGNGQNVRSVPSNISPQVTPFQTPSEPSFTSAGALGTKIQYKLSPAVTGGGLTPVKYNVFLRDASGGAQGTILQSWAPLLDASVNTVIITTDLSANKQFVLTANAFVEGPDASGILQTPRNIYSSTIRLAGPILTSTLPVFTPVPVIDASGLLQIRTTNNGAPLNFVEGLVIDGSNNLFVATAKLSGSTLVAPFSQGITVTTNDGTSSSFTINFGPLNSSNVQILSVIANSAGAAVYETIPPL